MSQSDNPLGPITDLTLRALLDAHKNEIFYGLNCHQVGQVVSFDAAKQTASVQIMMQREVFNQTQETGGQLQLTPLIVNYPVLVDCPVFVLAGGGAVVTMPIAAGDPCLVLFNDRDIDTWFAAGTVSPPNSGRAHSLSDGFALVGFRNASNRIAGYATDNLELKYLGGRIQVAAKIGINNASTSLKTVIDNLITALTTGWVDTHGDVPSPATISLLNAVKTLADSLLK